MRLQNKIVISGDTLNILAENVQNVNDLKIGDKFTIDPEAAKVLNIDPNKVRTVQLLTPIGLGTRKSIDVVYDKDKYLKRPTNVGLGREDIGAVNIKYVIKLDGLNEETKRNEIDPSYTHFAVRKTDNKIVTGWDYKDLDRDEIAHWAKLDLKDMDLKPSEYKILSVPALKRLNIDPFNYEQSWAMDLYENNTADIQNNKIANILLQWIQVYGGKDLMRRNGIVSPETFITALRNNVVTPTDIDNVTKSHAKQLFSKLPKTIELINNISIEPLNESKKPKNKLKGGKGDKLTPDMVNPYELKKGLDIESEHTDDYEERLEIVLDHLAEDPGYYTNLIAFEDSTKKSKRTDLPKEIKDKKLNVASDKLKDKDNDMEVLKKNPKKEAAGESLNSKEKAKGKPKGVKEMTTTPKSSKGVEKMKLPGKEKKIKLKESVNSLWNEFKKILLS